MRKKHVASYRFRVTGCDGRIIKRRQKTGVRIQESGEMTEKREE